MVKMEQIVYDGRSVSDGFRWCQMVQGSYTEKGCQMVKMVHLVYDDQSVSDGYQIVQGGYTIDILYTLDSASLLVN